MDTHYRPRRDFQGLGRRRQKAGRLFAAGELILADIARMLSVSRQSVSRWYREWKQRGTRALRGAGRAGRKPRIERTDLRRIERALRQGPRAHGFDTDLWTLPRVAVLIERLTGVRYHPGHIWKILGAIDWTLQRPARRARERDGEAIKLWMSQKWPEVKKTLAAKRRGSSSRTKAESRNAPRSAERGPGEAKRRS